MSQARARAQAQAQAEMQCQVALSYCACAEHPRPRRIWSGGSLAATCVRARVAIVRLSSGSAVHCHCTLLAVICRLLGERQRATSAAEPITH